MVDKKHSLSVEKKILQVKPVLLTGTTKYWMLRFQWGKEGTKQAKDYCSREVIVDQELVGQMLTHAICNQKSMRSDSLEGYFKVTSNKLNDHPEEFDTFFKDTFGMKLRTFLHQMETGESGTINTGTLKERFESWFEQARAEYTQYMGNLFEIKMMDGTLSEEAKDVIDLVTIKKDDDS